MKRNPEDVPKGPPAPTNTTEFGPPIISPAVADPAAARYARDIAARRGAAAPARYTAPVAGGPTPPIPRLDAPSTDGLTMSDQAGMQRAGAAPSPQPAPAPQPRRGMFQAEAPPEMPQAPGLSRPPPSLLPGDVLPNEARQDPEFREGQGSMYATSQPGLAYKYGVIRKGTRLAPQQLTQGPGRPTKMSPEDWQNLATFQGKKTEAEGEDRSVEKEAAAGPAGAAGRLGNSPENGPQSDVKSQQAVTEAVKKLDDFDFNTFREMMMKDIINNETQREIIEARCKPMTIDDLIMQGFVTQRVPIIPEKFEPEFQSMAGGEDLAIKRLIMEESKGVEVSDRYLLDKFSLMAVTVGLRAINSNVLPDHRDKDGKFSEELFWRKFEKVTSWPFHMLASIGVNYFWFDVRVRKLFVAEKVSFG